MIYSDIEQRIEGSNREEIVQLVKSKPELFRTNIKQNQIDKFKNDVETGASNPAYFTQFQNKNEAVKSISKKTNTFKNRFRKGYRSETVDAETIQWGLKSH